MSYEQAQSRVVSARTTKGRVVKTRVYVEPTGLGLSLSDFNPLNIAQKIQSGADRLATNIQTGVNYVEQGQQKLDTLLTSVATAGQHTAAAVQGGARGAIASGATGDVSSGLTAAALTTKPLLIAGGLALVYFVFLRHPGHRGW